MDNEAKKAFFDANCKFKIGQIVYCLSVKDRHKGIAILVVVQRDIHECHGGFQKAYYCQGDNELLKLNESVLMSDDEFFEWFTTTGMINDDKVRRALKRFD